MNVIEAIQTKRAIREYQDKPIPEEVVYAILDAGRRAQSSKNTQPWQFIAVQDKATLKTLSTLGKYASHMKDAPLGIVFAAPAGTEFDLGQAAAYMQLIGTEYGVGSCLIAIYEPEEAKKLLGIPNEYQVRISIAFGYPSEAEQKKSLGKGRKDFQEVVHWEKW
jgi:nitroreductase